MPIYFDNDGQGFDGGCFDPDDFGGMSPDTPAEQTPQNPDLFADSYFWSRFTDITNGSPMRMTGMQTDDEIAAQWAFNGGDPNDLPLNDWSFQAKSDYESQAAYNQWQAENQQAAFERQQADTINQEASQISDLQARAEFIMKMQQYLNSHLIDADAFNEAMRIYDSTALNNSSSTNAVSSSDNHAEVTGIEQGTPTVSGQVYSYSSSNDNLNTFSNNYDLNGMNVNFLVDPSPIQSSENLGETGIAQGSELDVSVDLSKAPVGMAKGEYAYRVFLQYLKDKYHLNFSIDTVITAIKNSAAGLTFSNYSESKLEGIAKSANPSFVVVLTEDYLKSCGLDIQKLIRTAGLGSSPAGAYTIESDGMSNGGGVSRDASSSDAGGINYTASDDDNTFAPSMAGRDEVNRITIDFVKEFGNILRDIVQGIIDTAVQGIAANNIGVNPTATPDAYNLIKDHYLTLPKFSYESEMMRRNINGEVDGAGIHAGDFIDEGAAAIAPLVVGDVFTTPEPILSVVPRGELIIEADRTLSPEELAFARKMVGENRKVTARIEPNTPGANNADFDIDGEIVEFKHVSNLQGTDSDSLSG